MSLHFSLFDGPDLAVDFENAADALAYMAEHADSLGGDMALLVFDERACRVALVDARKVA